MNTFETLLSGQGFRFIAGVDEAGRGPLAGPVAAAAVIFKTGVYPPGIKDSKKLSPRRREELFYKICENALSVGLGIVNEKTIDKINIFQAAHLAMIRAVRSLETKPDFILFDGNLAPASGIKQKAVPGGDSKSVSIAAASIIAKVTRDRIMAGYDVRFPGYGFGQHKGYPTRSHIESLMKLGPCKIHRLSFRPVAEAIKTPAA